MLPNFRILLTVNKCKLEPVFVGVELDNESVGVNWPGLILRLNFHFIFTEKRNQAI